MNDPMKDAHNAAKDAEREWVERGSDEDKGKALGDCPCCFMYERKGKIFNAGQWISCPMCSPSPPKT